MAKCPECGAYKKSKRSIRQSKLYWCVIKFLWIHQDDRTFPRPENLHQTIKLCIGYTEPILDSRGKQIGTALKSTSFSKMSADEFNEYFEKVKNFIWEKILPNYDEEFERELCNIFGITPPHDS